MLDIEMSKDGSQPAASLGRSAYATSLDNRSSLDPSGLNIFSGCPRILEAVANNLVLPAPPTYT